MTNVFDLALMCLELQFGLLRLIRLTPEQKSQIDIWLLSV